MEHWSAAESLLLITLVEERGKKWAELVPHFPGRTTTQLRNRNLRIQKGRASVEAGTARNLCRLCGEIRASHICKGRDANGPENEAAMQRIRAACAAANLVHAKNKGEVKRPSRGRHAAAQRREPQRAPWLPTTTGSTREHGAIVDFIQGGTGGVPPS